MKQLFFLLIVASTIFAEQIESETILSKNSKIFVAGHNGLVGSAIVRALQAKGFNNLLLRTSKELDLRNQQLVNDFFRKEQPEFVFLAAAKVGGIIANNTYPADFIRDNLMVELNVIDAAAQYGTKKLLFMGSSCIYPREAPQPMAESCLLTSPLEKTNEAYAIAKIAGIKLCQAYRRQYKKDFISCMPTNLYGQNDNFHPENSHVIPGLLQRFYKAKKENSKEMVIWGSGNVYREFLHVDDLAEAAIFLMQSYSDEEIVNVGSGKDVTIRELVKMIAKLIDFKGELIFDTSKPDGTPRKLLNIDKIKMLGWEPKIELEQGLKETIEWFEKSYDKIRQ